MPNRNVVAVALVLALILALTTGLLLAFESESALSGEPDNAPNEVPVSELE